MPRREALILEAGGELFRFYYDRLVPGLLDITLHHGTTPEEAIATFFEGETNPWDETHLRFQTETGQHVLYWTRRALDQSVIVISCFRREEEE